jgi:single-strand DNA-binding protein
MKSFNKVMLMGHLAADPELRETKSGKKVASFRIATNRRTKHGEKPETADFHRIAAWQGLGEICNNHLIKGSAVLVEGKLINDIYEKADGTKQYSAEVWADNINIITWNKKKQDVEINEVKEVAAAA